MPAEVSGVPMSKLWYHWFLPISSVHGGSSSTVQGSAKPSPSASGSKKKAPRPLDSSTANTTHALSVTSSPSESYPCAPRRGRVDAVLARLGRSALPSPSVSATQNSVSVWPLGELGLPVRSVTVPAHWSLIPNGSASAKSQ